MAKLNFHKMWEAADTYVFDIDTGSIMPILDSLPKVASYADKHWLFHFEKGIGAAYYEESDMAKASEAGLKDFTDPVFRDKYFKDIASILDSEMLFYQSVEDTDLKKISDSELKELLKSGVKAIVENFGYYLACQPQCVSNIEKKVREEISAVVGFDKVDEAFTLLSTPTSETKIRKEEKDWLNLVIKCKKERINLDDNRKLIEDHYKKYSLLNAADGHEPYNVSYFEEKLKIDIQSPVELLFSRLAELDQSLNDIEFKKQKYIKDFKIPEHISDLCEILARIGHWRLEMRFVWMPGYYYDKKILSEIAKRFKVSSDLIRFATVNEILGLFDNKLLEESELWPGPQISYTNLV